VTHSDVQTVTIEPHHACIHLSRYGDMELSFWRRKDRVRVARRVEQGDGHREPAPAAEVEIDDGNGADAARIHRVAEALDVVSVAVDGHAHRGEHRLAARLGGRQRAAGEPHLLAEGPRIALSIGGGGGSEEEEGSHEESAGARHGLPIEREWECSGGFVLRPCPP
jgi:hypothetical protein